MGLRQTLRSWDRRLTEMAIGERTLSAAQFFGTGGDLPRRGRTAAGVAVTFDTALGLPVVQRAFNLMVGDIGPLPIDGFRRVGGRRVPMDTPPWVEVPDPANPNRRRPQFIGDLVTSIMGDGNLFIRAYPDRFNPVFIRVMDPWRTAIETDADGVDTYRTGTAVLTSAQVIHVPFLVRPGQSRGYSPIVLLEEAIASGIAAMRFGGYFFSNGAAMQGLVTTPPGAQVDAKTLKEELRRGNAGLTNSHAIGVLTGGADFKELTAKPQDSQMVEFQKFVVEECGRAFGIPPYLLGSQEPGAVAYASTSNARIDYVQHGVQPIVTRIEHALSTLLPGDDTFLRFNLDALLRGDQKARYEAYQAALQSRFATVDEVRALEDWTPFGAEGGGFLNSPNNVARDPRFEDAAALIRAGFDPAGVLDAIGLPPIKHTGALPVTVQAEDAEPPAERADPVVIHNHLPEPGPVNVSVTNRTSRVIDVNAADRYLARRTALRARIDVLRPAA